jgi:hypothetical protein
LVHGSIKRTDTELLFLEEPTTLALKCKPRLYQYQPGKLNLKEFHHRVESLRHKHEYGTLPGDFEGRWLVDTADRLEERELSADLTYRDDTDHIPCSDESEAGPSTAHCAPDNHRDTVSVEDRDNNSLYRSPNPAQEAVPRRRKAHISLTAEEGEDDVEDAPLLAAFNNAPDFS